MYVHSQKRNTSLNIIFNVFFLNLSRMSIWWLNEHEKNFIIPAWTNMIQNLNFILCLFYRKLEFLISVW